MTIERGRSHRHPNSSIWSVRTRWREARIQTKTANSSQAFPSTHAIPGMIENRVSRAPPTKGIDSRLPWNGASHPPRKNSAKRRHAANDRMYSAMNMKPHRRPPYSVHHPSTSSASASGISNGMRSTSAIIVIRNSAAPRGIMNTFQMSPSLIWKSTISMMLKEPLSTQTPSTVISRGIS